MKLYSYVHVAKYMYGYICGLACTHVQWHWNKSQVYMLPVKPWWYNNNVATREIPDNMLTEMKPIKSKPLARYIYMHDEILTQLSERYD